jgi:hypothetical protein
LARNAHLRRNVRTVRRELREQVGDDPRFVFLRATWERVLPLMPDRSVESVVGLDIIGAGIAANNSA